MARRTDRRAPRLQPIELPALVDGDPDLEADTGRDGERLTDLALQGADLTGLVLDGCAVHGAAADGALLDAARLVETVIERLTASGLRAARSTWRDVRLEGSRLGAAELFDAEWLRVAIESSRIDYLNLSGGRLTDVRLTGCTIGDLDLRGATVTRLALPGCRIATLSLKDARLESVDLRGAEIERIDGAAHLAGAIVDPPQLVRLAPLLAEALGVTVEDLDEGSRLP